MSSRVYVIFMGSTFFNFLVSSYVIKYSGSSTKVGCELKFGSMTFTKDKAGVTFNKKTFIILLGRWMHSNPDSGSPLCRFLILHLFYVFVSIKSDFRGYTITQV